MKHLFSGSDSPLQVRRVRHYRVAKYPSHLDPDPTLLPQPVPYPWKSSLAAAMLAMSSASCGKKPAMLATVGAPAGPTPGQVMIEQIAMEALKQPAKGEENPFAQARETSGLPYRSSPYGTGQPTPMDEELARQLILYLFKAEGIAIQPHKFDEKDFAFEAESYDEKSKIGYVIAGWRNLASDAILEWWMYNVMETASGKVPASKEEADGVRQSIQTSLDYSQRGTGLKFTEEEIEEVKSKTDLREMAQALLKLRAKRDRPKLSMEEIQRTDALAAARERYVAVVPLTDSRFYLQETPELMAKQGAIYAEAQKKKFATPDEQSAWMEKEMTLLMQESQRSVYERLATAVREYIAWARRNGVQ